jgi:hypothetical protein
VDKQERWGIKMRTIWKIHAAMRNQEYNLPDWVSKTSYGCYYLPDQDMYLPYRDLYLPYRELYLLYWGRLIDSHTKFPQVPVSHDDFPHLL